MIIFSINGTGTTGHQHAKILIQSYNLHISQKLTQAGSQRPKYKTQNYKIHRQAPRRTPR